MIAHVDPAKRDVLQSLYARAPPVSGGPFGHARVVETGEAELVAAVPPGSLERLASDPEELAMLQAIDCHSYIIVPLRLQSRVIGAIVLARGASARPYDAADLVLASDLARRTAAAIDNARLYELAEQERSRAVAATRAKDEFVAMVSHELRTPLNTILGWVRLLRGGTLPPEKSAHALGVVERNANALNRIVADLLDMSRIFVGKVRVEPSNLDFAKVLDMAIEGLRPAADAKRIEIEVDVDRAHAELRGDAERLEQLTWNLLANAVKFTPKGGKVAVRVRRVDTDLELVVEDNGVGITPSFLPHVFEPFRQSDASASRAHGGLGLGLSIARHIVELHGGEIEAKSDGLGRGAKFVVRIPATPPRARRGGRRAHRHPPAPSEPSAGTTVPADVEGLSVLVVDDEPDARELIAMFFETCGMQARVAASVAEAMRAIAAAPPHVIVSDIGMPGEDGYALIRRVRMLAGPAKDIPAIALTAFARNEDRTRARALLAGFNLHMAKPVELEHARQRGSRSRALRLEPDGRHRDPADRRPARAPTMSRCGRSRARWSGSPRGCDPASGASDSTGTRRGRGAPSADPGS